MRVLDVRNDVHALNFDGGGIACETNSGAIIYLTAKDGNARIWRSTDDGQNWSQRATMTISSGFTGVRGLFVDSRGYIYAGGTTQTTYEDYTRFAELWRSTDDGITWAKVCTAETSAFWHLDEDSTGRVYVNEYSLVPTAGTEYPAVNVWRSDVNGTNFAKWWTGAKETAPNAKDGIRHLHTLCVDGSDRVYVAAGDTGWTGDASKVLQLNSSGVVTIDYGAPFGNGITSMMPTADGRVLLGNDFNPSGIMAIPQTVSLNCRQLNLRMEKTNAYDAYVFDLLRGRDGDVIFGQTSLTGRTPLVLFSTDEGANWHGLDYGGASPGSPTMTLNRNAARRRIYCSGTPAFWIPDYDADFLRRRALI